MSNIESNLKRDRESMSEDTEEGRRSFAMELCNLTLNDNLVAPARKLPHLEEILQSWNDPQLPLYRNRELLAVVYREVDTITIEKVHGTTNFVVTYCERDFNAGNDFQPPDRVYIGTAEECQRFHPTVFSL
jgi:hypothetical protein